jgi:hypothetical protein
MKESILSLITCFVLVFTFGCRKSDSVSYFPTRTVYTIPDDFKEWAMYQPGSYWVYLNEKSGVTDCTSYKRGPYYHEDVFNDPFMPSVEYMWFFTKGSLFTRYDIQGGKAGNATLRLWMGNGDELFALTHKTITDSAHADTSTYLYPYSYKLIEMLDTLTLNNNHFFQVYHVGLTKIISDEPPPVIKIFYDFYWSRAIGLICFKKSYMNYDTTWSLVRWKSIQ